MVPAGPQIDGVGLAVGIGRGDGLADTGGTVATPVVPAATSVRVAWPAAAAVRALIPRLGSRPAPAMCFGCGRTIPTASCTRGVTAEDAGAWAHAAIKAAELSNRRGLLFMTSIRTQAWVATDALEA
jgi:hypothetical protein